MSRRILIVDDEKPVRSAWHRALKLAGYSVSAVGNAQEALRECDQHPFDLVVVDFIMPSMDGVELLRRIRRRLPYVRSIIVSGKLDEKVRESDIGNTLRESIEADVYLHKPVSNERLKASIEELLTGPSPESSWQEIAKKAGDARKATIQGAKHTAKTLRKLLKKRRVKS